MQSVELREFAEQWRIELEGGTMDKRKAVFRQLIGSARFNGEELEIVPNLTTLAGAGAKLASPRGFEPRSRP